MHIVQRDKPICIGYQVQCILNKLILDFSRQEGSTGSRILHCLYCTLCGDCGDCGDASGKEKHEGVRCEMALIDARPYCNRWIWAQEKTSCRGVNRAVGRTTLHRRKHVGIGVSCGCHYLTIFGSLHRHHLVTITSLFEGHLHLSSLPLWRILWMTSRATRTRIIMTS
jgi:hypothetical protein